MYKDNSAKLLPLGACGGNTTQNSLPLFEKSCALIFAMLKAQKKKVNIKKRIFDILKVT
jgi:hypothetical protein